MDRILQQGRFRRDCIIIRRGCDRTPARFCDGAGPSGYRVNVEKHPPSKLTDPKLTTVDVKPLGPSAAREIGMYSLKTKGPDPKEVTGKYVVVWEKIGNDWKLATDIWNDGK